MTSGPHAVFLSPTKSIARFQEVLPGAGGSGASRPYPMVASVYGSSEYPRDRRRPTTRSTGGLKIEMPRDPKRRRASRGQGHRQLPRPVARGAVLPDVQTDLVADPTSPTAEVILTPPPISFHRYARVARVRPKGLAPRVRLPRGHWVSASASGYSSLVSTESRACVAPHSASLL